MTQGTWGPRSPASSGVHITGGHVLDACLAARDVPSFCHICPWVCADLPCTSVQGGASALPSAELRLRLLWVWFEPGCPHSSGCRCTCRLSSGGTVSGDHAHCPPTPRYQLVTARVQAWHQGRASHPNTASVCSPLSGPFYSSPPATLQLDPNSVALGRRRTRCDSALFPAEDSEAGVTYLRLQSQCKAQWGTES